MNIGKLNFTPVEDNLNLIGKPVQESVQANKLSGVLVSEIDPAVSDTAAFCERYGIGLDISVNCVIVEAKRADRTWYAACLVPATMRADINGIVRRELGAKKVSFAPMDRAVSLSGMEYGGISPLGLPADWLILVDSQAAALPQAIVGSGVRESKLAVSGELLASLPNAKVLTLTRE